MSCCLVNRLNPGLSSVGPWDASDWPIARIGIKTKSTAAAMFGYLQQTRARLRRNTVMFQVRFYIPSGVPASMAQDGYMVTCGDSAGLGYHREHSLWCRKRRVPHGSTQLSKAVTSHGGSTGGSAGTAGGRFGERDPVAFCD